MNKRGWLDGITTVGLGVFLLVIGLLPGIRTGEHLIRLAIIYIVSGAVSTSRYFYYHSGKNKEFYKEKLEYEEIERTDERNIQIRDKAGRYAQRFGMYVTAAVMIAALVLEAFGIVRDAEPVVLWFGTYLIVQVIAEQVIFEHLSKKY